MYHAIRTSLLLIILLKELLRYNLATVVITVILCLVYLCYQVIQAVNVITEISVFNLLNSAD